MYAKTALMVVLAAMMMFATEKARAAEYQLPDATELSGFSRDAMQFYMAGIDALDRIDHVNGYINLVKAAQLQPDAVRLNMITAAVAMKFGRRKPAAEAAPYYDTAISCYRNVLKRTELSDRFLRDAQNRLRVAVEEKENLAQRDNKREALGSAFVMAYNREIAEETPTPTPAPTATPAPGAQPPGMAAAANPYAVQPGMMAPGMMPGANPYAPAPAMQPGMMAPGMGDPTMMQPGMPPGMMPQGGFPGQPGMPETGQPLI